MIGFSQWWRTFNKSKKIFPHYYLLGTERVLIDEIVDNIKKYHTSPDWNRSYYVEGINDEVEIWERMFDASIDGSPMLTIVSNAEKLKNLHLIPELVTTKPNNHVIIFISSEEKIEKVRVQNEDDVTWELPEHLRTFEKKGKIIECQPFTQTTAKTAVQWLKEKVEAKDGAIAHLLNESNGDLRLVRDVVQKLNWMEQPATVRNITVMLHKQPSDTFLDALVALDKENAMRALQTIPENDYLQLIGLLDAQIDLAGRVNILMKQHKTIPVIMKEIGSQAFLVPSISKVARHYSPGRVRLVRKLIAEADRRLRYGDNEGVMESLVALW